LVVPHHMAGKSEAKENAPSGGADEDLGLEFYELRDEAVKRVAIKTSVKIHFVVWAVINIFLLILNLVSVDFQVTGLGDFWVFWTLCAWGLGLYIHATAWFTLNVKNIGKKMFFLHLLIGIGVILFVATVNLLTFPTYQWFWWIVGGEFAFILLHYYITFISTRWHVEQAIKHEIEFLKQQKSNEN
jgi:hypothetical protein